MPTPLDWLGVPTAPQTSYLAPALPYRTYGLTAQDAVMQGEDALGGLRAGAQYADILRQQQLAPLQQQVTQQQLQNQAQVQPLVNSGREQMISSLAALNPASETYLDDRRNAVMQNPYGLADPVVQEVLRTNDRAYDDYLNTQRVNMMGSAKPLTPTQKMALNKRISAVTDSMIKSNEMGDSARASQYAKELQSLHDMLSGATDAGPATESPAPAQSFNPPGSVVPSANKFQSMEAKQRWQTAKELVLGAIEKEAEGTGKSTEEIMQELGNASGAAAKEFFQKHLNVSPESLAFEETTNPWYSSGYGNDMKWSDVYKSLKGDDDLLRSKSILPRASRGMGPIEPFSETSKTESSKVVGKPFKIKLVSP